MSNILFLLSQYGILEQTARHVSALDLLHLASTCSELYTVIRKSELVFDRLKRVALCDGRGLKARQEFQGLYGLSSHHSVWGQGRRAHYDEELEVRVWNLKCDPANALPCLRCGVNVCEECRYVPRVQYTPGYRSRRRPHCEGSYQSHTVVCYCAACDEKVERGLALDLSEYCDCDQYSRWICLPCKVKENQLDSDYYKMRTRGDWEWRGDADEGMWLHDHQHSRAFWCPCGERAPKGGNVRCAWCRRRHNINTWMAEDPSAIPFFDDDPCYPKIVRHPDTFDVVRYADLGYTGLIAP